MNIIVQYCTNNIGRIFECANILEQHFTILYMILTKFGSTKLYFIFWILILYIVHYFNSYTFNWIPLLKFECRAVCYPQHRQVWIWNIAPIGATMKRWLLNWTNPRQRQWSSIFTLAVAFNNCGGSLGLSDMAESNLGTFNLWILDPLPSSSSNRNL